MIGPIMKTLLAVITVSFVFLSINPQASAIQCPDGSFLPDEQAADCPPAPPAPSGPCGGSSFLGIPAWYKYLGTETVGGRCTPVIQRDGQGKIQPSSILPIGIAVLEALLRIAAYVAVVMVIWGAFKFMLTQGEPDKAASARKTVINALVGLVIVILAASLVGFIGSELGG